VSEQTLYVWRRKFRDSSVEEVRQLKAVVEENKKLKKLLAEQLLAIEVLKEVNSKKW
jgi:putative transposase